jgi:hypothetical protein
MGRLASPGRTAAKSCVQEGGVGGTFPRQDRRDFWGPLPTWIQFFRPRATGRIEFSARLLLNSNSG